MTAMQRPWAAEIIHFWFHKLSPSDWFGPTEAVDAALRERFEPELLALHGQPASRFLNDPQIALAAVLLFDQIPRNIYRGSARSFFFDHRAREICRGALAAGFDAALSQHQRQFLGMPLMHSENIADQLLSKRYFTQLNLPVVRRFAEEHYAMIARFGRFPHRNTVLGRESSDQEKRAVEAGFAW
ncbi:DUF924 family protein [Altericroceibacterium endophyticum]|uniref:DUF924 family protein n=1 Tax=Altericroceibacterium endophyticum TaxID=1808508 RepID=A0A6I4T3L7_9SPHN|nr:DUF924 family protein [Altericroceibacterium endophyticum]MXO65874.1 DUF924 family protein [Altericroceibacterium endophyticum]